MLNILIVEDDKAISNLICSNLKSEGYMCDYVYDGEKSIDMIDKNKYDLILLDIMLPNVNGYEIMEYVRYLDIPVIFISAKSQVDDRIKGLKLGADDYIVKPFQIGELLARIECVLRRSNKFQKTICIDDVKVELDSHIVLKNGKQIELTIKEFKLLVELIRNKNIALYRDKLYENVWEEEYTGETRTLDLHIQKLRKKLDWNEKIKTVFRIGYRLEV